MSLKRFNHSLGINRSVSDERVKGIYYGFTFYTYPLYVVVAAAVGVVRRRHGDGGQGGGDERPRGLRPLRSRGEGLPPDS